MYQITTIITIILLLLLLIIIIIATTIIIILITIKIMNKHKTVNQRRCWMSWKSYLCRLVI